MTSPQGLIAPDTDPDSRPWWEAVAQHRFLLPRCAACGQYSFPPQPACPHCLAAELSLQPASGSGAIYSWIVVHRALDPAFLEDVPYTILAVDLAEGPRIWGRLLSDEAPTPGAPVQVAFYEVQGQPLLGFRGRAGAGGPRPSA